MNVIKSIAVQGRIQDFCKGGPEKWILWVAVGRGSGRGQVGGHGAIRRGAEPGSAPLNPQL